MEYVKYKDAKINIQTIIESGSKERVIINDLLDYMIKYDIYSLNNLTWQQINDVCASGNAETQFSIGDYKTIYIDGKLYNLIILGFKHEKIMPDITALYKEYDNNSYVAGITFGLKEIYSGVFQFDNCQTNLEKFQDTVMNYNLNSYIYDLLPEDLKQVMKPIIRNYNGEEESFYNVFLPTEYEVLGYNKFSNNNPLEAQYNYFADITEENTCKQSSDLVKNYTYWTASKYKDNNTSYIYINKAGRPLNALATGEYGISFNLCV